MGRGRHHDHALSGEWADYRDCHVKPDLVLVSLARWDDDRRTPRPRGLADSDGVIGAVAVRVAGQGMLRSTISPCR